MAAGSYRSTRVIRMLSVAAAACLLPARSLAQESVVAAYLAPPPVIDGHLLAAEWSQAAHATWDGDSLLLGYDRDYAYLGVQWRKGIRPPQLDFVMPSGRTVRIPGAPGAKCVQLETFDGAVLEARVPWSVLGPMPRQGQSILVRPSSFGFEGTVPRAYPRLRWSGFPEARKEATEIKFLPYVLGGADERHEGVLDAGLDAVSRYRGINFRGSAVPEFRTVERAILSLDFSYFERLAPDTRPFFTEGASYFNDAYFASQRIDTFDAAGKLYGNLDNKSKIGVLDAADFWQGNEFVGSYSHQMDPNGTFSAGIKAFHEPTFTNAFYSVGANYRLGPFRLASNAQMTEDSDLGVGNSMTSEVAYRNGGIFGRLAGAQTSGNFLDRLGYYTETDVRGLDGSLGGYRTYRTGPFTSSSVTFFTSQYRYLDDSPYRHYNGGAASVDFRDGSSFTLGTTIGRFLVNNDRIVQFAATSPKSVLRLDAVAGNLASHSYSSVTLSTRWSPTRRVLVVGSLQRVHHYENMTQTILHCEYNLARDQEIVGRLVQFQGDLNFYIKYLRRAPSGAEFAVLLGDPNAPRFQRSLILKVIWPIDLRF